MPSSTSSSPPSSTIAIRPRRPGRPNATEGPAVTRQAIVDAALRTLADCGYPGLSLRGLARSLGVSLATVQRHFATKDDLWRAAIDAALPLPSGTDGATSRQPGHGPGAELRNTVHRALTRPGVTAAVWNDTTPGASERLDHLTARAGAVLQEGRERLGAGIASGTLRPIDVNALLALVGLGITSVASSGDGLRRLFGIDIDDPTEQDRLADSLTDILLNGILLNGILADSISLHDPSTQSST
jgi:AcrR family transcriptional regulator